MIKGVVVEGESGLPIPLATVLAKELSGDTIIEGSSTADDGSFSMLVGPGAFMVEISFLSFETVIISDIPRENGMADLGTIVMSPDGEVIDEAVVQAERSSMEFKLDKRVFNVGKDLANAGASALEVLDNVPSVNVTIEGQVSLRGATGVQMLINGKPSVLASEEGNALGTITADMIEKVEVITNPGAKYEAEGTAGIINIVLKKDERKGVNGSVTLNTGVPQNHSLGFSISSRTEKFNLFSQLGIGYREMPNERRNINTNVADGTSILSEGEEFRNEGFGNLVLGADYYINERNVITLSGNFSYEIEDQPSETNFELLGASDELISSWRREEITEATNPKYQYDLKYKREFADDKEHTLEFSSVGNLFAKDQSSEFLNTNITGEEVPERQRTRTDFRELRNTFKLDYSKPFNEFWSMETGAQFFINDVGNDFSVSDFIDDVFVVDSSLTNRFEFDQEVLGIYASGAYEAKKWGLKMGLRAEHTLMQTYLAETGEESNQNFSNLFPSAATSYKFSDRFSMQASYSRRIYRPRLWSLNPFFNIRNNFSIRTGNPELQPEFTDSYELTAINQWDAFSINASLYQRITTDVIDRITRLDENVSVTMPMNLGTRTSTGIEVNGKWTVNKKLSFRGDFNWNTFVREGATEDLIIDFQADQWSTSITGKMKFDGDLDVELTGRYNSSVQTIQGSVSDILFANLGLRKKIMNGKGVINASVRDIFASRIRESEAIQEDFRVYSRSLRGRFITLGFSYSFGKGEAMQYSGGRRH